MYIVLRVRESADMLKERVERSFEPLNLNTFEAHKKCMTWAGGCEIFTQTSVPTCQRPRTCALKHPTYQRPHTCALNMDQLAHDRFALLVHVQTQNICTCKRMCCSVFSFCGVCRSFSLHSSCITWFSWIFICVSPQQQQQQSHAGGVAAVEVCRLVAYVGDEITRQWLCELERRTPVTASDLLQVCLVVLLCVR